MKPSQTRSQAPSVAHVDSWRILLLIARDGNARTPSCSGSTDREAAPPVLEPQLRVAR